MTGSYCGRSSKDWKQDARDVSIVIRQLEAEIDAPELQKPVNTQAAAMAGILLLFALPTTKPQVVAILTLLIPFLKTIFFEIGAIASFSFAFRAQAAPVRKLRSSPPRLAEKVEAEVPAIEPRPSAKIVRLISAAVLEGARGYSASITPGSHPKQVSA